MHAANAVIVSRLAQQPCGKYDCLHFSTGNLHQQDACFSPPHLFTPPPPASLLHLFLHLFLLSLLSGNMLVKQPQLWKNRCVGKENCRYSAYTVRLSASQEAEHGTWNSLTAQIGAVSHYVSHVNHKVCVCVCENHRCLFRTTVAQ